MVFVTLETTYTTSQKEPIPLGYKHDDPKKRAFSVPWKHYWCYLATINGAVEWFFSLFLYFFLFSLSPQPHTQTLSLPNALPEIPVEVYPASQESRIVHDPNPNL